MPNPPPWVFIFCALTCEAKPLVKAWNLRRLPSTEHPFAIYCNDERAVIVSGIGKTNMAGAVGYALALFNKPKQPAIVNIGIAGHRIAQPGSIFLGHKISDAETGRNFYPQIPFGAPCKTQAILTKSAPNTEYRGSELFEMEASGFYELAIKFSSCELVHSVKIVSDNTESSIANINEASVEALVMTQVPVIDNIIGRLNTLRATITDDAEPIYRELIGEYHFTATSSLQLRGLLRRWRLIKGNGEILWREAHLKNAKALLDWLEGEIDDTEFYL